MGRGRGREERQVDTSSSSSFQVGLTAAPSPSVLKERAPTHTHTHHTLPLDTKKELVNLNLHTAKKNNPLCGCSIVSFGRDEGGGKIS